MNDAREAQRMTMDALLPARSAGPGLDALRAGSVEAFSYGVLLTLTTPPEAQRLAAAIAAEYDRLTAQENPMSVSQLQTDTALAPSLDEGLLALALYEVDGFGLLSECRKSARDIAAVYRRLAQEGETPT